MKRNDLKMLFRVGFFLVCIFIAISTCIFAFMVFLTPHEASSLAIIGDIDGPTAFFVAKPLKGPIYSLFTVIIIILLALGLALKSKKK